MAEIFNLKEINNVSTKDIITDYDKLSERSDEFDLTKKNSDIQTIIAKLKKIIRSDDSIVALSAPQIGYNKRIICMDFNKDIRTFINPVIDNVKGLGLSKETCHSIPDKTYIRIRHPEISVTFQTPLGKIQTVKLVGLAANMMQHHIDHLEGILLSDIGFEIDDEWEKASEEERQEVIDYYIDSLDLKASELNKEISDNTDTKQLADAIRFMNSVREGKTKIEKIPLTDEEIAVIKEYKAEKENKDNAKQ